MQLLCFIKRLFYDLGCLFLKLALVNNFQHIMLTEAIIILILIILNGVLSASEISIVSSRKARLQAESDKNNPAAKIALHLKESPNSFLSTVQIGITLIGILTGFFSGGSISA